MTSISFERSGGLIGKELHLELDLNKMPEDEAEYLHRLIDEADFFNLPRNLAMRSTADEFLYNITVDNGVESHTIQVTDTTMPSSLLPLVKELTLQKILH